MNIKILAVASVLAVSVAGQALAMKLVEDKPAFAGPELDYAKAVSGTYVLDDKHASVTWKIWHLGFSHYTGRFEKVAGTLAFNPDDLKANKVSVSIDPASATTGYQVMDAKLASAEFFDAAKFPVLQFESTGVDVTGKDANGKAVGKVTGNLTLHGVTKPVVLDVTFNGSGANPFSGSKILGFSGKTMIKRSDFGIKFGLPAVGDEVEIGIEVEFSKAG